MNNTRSKNEEYSTPTKTKNPEPFTITISGDDTAENIKKAQTLSKHFDEGSTGIMTQTFGAK